jgi:hypothetical protein
MEQRMESKEWKWGGTVTQSENGHVIRFLATIEEFYTRSCARCAGLLVNDWCYDLANTGEHNAEVLRCVQCGNRVDPVIEQNQCPTAGRERSRAANATEAFRQHGAADESRNP